MVCAARPTEARPARQEMTGARATAVSFQGGWMVDHTQSRWNGIVAVDLCLEPAGAGLSYAPTQEQKA
jgi:hypothetical protein